MEKNLSRAESADRELKELFSKAESADYHIQAILNLMESRERLDRSDKDQCYYHYLRFKKLTFS